MASYVKVAKAAEVPARSCRGVDAGGRRICLVRLDDKFYAVDDTCTHEGGPMSEGVLTGDEVECPWHAARFSVKTGEVRAEPAYEPLATYPVRVTGDDVEVEV